jgi:hypothetical protein
MIDTKEQLHKAADSSHGCIAYMIGARQKSRYCLVEELIFNPFVHIPFLHQ